MEEALPKPPTFPSLPDDVVQRILFLLDSESLHAARLVSKQWARIADENAPELWEQLCEKLDLLSASKNTVLGLVTTKQNHQVASCLGNTERANRTPSQARDAAKLFRARFMQ